ncbi:MAG: glycoside hydrolase family 3 C-terminal domain-containing protein, partial [Acidobacteriia bacterium]|nr:glycoside hydrolase family 3 C-terminal domain-containing protein [Terriglobia bacterium]
MQFRGSAMLFLAAFGLLLSAPAGALAQSESDLPEYRDPRQPVHKRVEDLLRRMTLKEKIGQLNMPCVYVEELGRDIPSKLEACKRFAEGIYTDEIGPGGGFFTLPNTILHEGTRQQVEYLNQLQGIALKQTRLGIPLLETEEGTHGGMFPGATIFPEGLALGSTWDMEVVKSIYATAAREARSVGIHQLYTLVVEPNRDPRLGRNAEGYSEDPYLCSRIAVNIVNGAQGETVSAPDKVVAGLCHYPGQSQPVSGLERGAMEISERTLREIFLPPWVAGIKKAGALGVMATYPEIDDVPTHSSEKLLTRILREELGFQGLVLGEGSGLSTLVYEGIAPTQKEAGAIALKAGLDVGISYEAAYLKPLIENVEEGRVSMHTVDRAVRRVLEQKFRLGLFENPYVDPGPAIQTVHAKEHQELALRAAREGIVLLKNEKNLLPLNPNVKSIAVIGPNANAPRNQLGDYTTTKVLQHVVTPLEGIKGRVSPQTQVIFAKGCDVLGSDKSGFPEATKAAKKSDIAIVIVGEQQEKDSGGNESDARNRPTVGEGFDVASLDLTGVQEDLIKAVAETGTPTVVVLINGRPLSIRWTAENVPAILEAWEPGEHGGEAIAEVLFGDYNPGGHLPITIPRHVGQLPAYYNFKPSKAYWIKEGWGERYVDMPATPLYPFGYGLSYTRFEYSNLRIDPPESGPAGTVRVSVDVKNIGARTGDEVVQLYIHDVL